MPPDEDAPGNDEDRVPQRTAGEDDVCVVCEKAIEPGSPVGLAPYGPGEERGGAVHLNDRCEQQRAHVS